MNIETIARSLCKVTSCTNETTLKENTSNATLKSVVLCDIPTGALVVKMDGIKFSNFLIDKKEWGYNKHSDYLIITDDKLVFIEMKSASEISKTLNDECIQKFSADECAVNYADLIFQKMLSKNTFFNKRETHYVLLFQKISMAKTPTTVIESQSNTTPNTFRSIPVVNEATISFSRTI